MAQHTSLTTSGSFAFGFTKPTVKHYLKCDICNFFSCTTPSALKEHTLMLCPDNPNRIPFSMDLHNQFIPIIEQEEKERIRKRDSTKVMCECGTEIRYDGLRIHRKTKKHMALLNALGNTQHIK